MRWLLVATVFCIASTAEAGNWPQWRGDNGNGVSTSATPPTEWSDTKNVKWKVPIAGLGSGSPVVWDDSVFVTTAVPTDASKPANSVTELSFEVLCFDRATGDQKWRQVATVATPHQATHSTNNFAPASPCTDGQHLYAHFGSRGLYCYTLSGDLVWKRTDFVPMETRNAFGEGSSPTLVDDKIIVPWDHEGPSSLYALNKTTGETIWQVSRDEPTNWITPLVVEHDGGKQIIITGQTAVRSHDLATGKELWRHANQSQRPVASPVSADGVVYAGHGFRGDFMGAFNLSGRGDLAGTANTLWTKPKGAPDLASFLLSGDRLYYTKAKTGVLSCVDPKTGEPYFSSQRTPLRGQLYASPIAAGGHIYLTDRSGTTVVLKDSTKFELVATNSVNETVDATPAPVDNELFIRGEKHLFCITK